MANLATDTMNKAHTPTPDFKSRIIAGEHQVEKMAQNAGEKIGAMASDFASTTADTVKSSREYVQSNPAKGVAIAAAAGLIAGSLLTMAMRSRRN